MGSSGMPFGGGGEKTSGIDVSKSAFEEGDIQKFLPPGLRYNVTGPGIEAAMRQIGGLLQHPGGLSPNVAEAVNPRLASESQNIAQNFRGLQANQTGAAARGNLPVSIKTALQSALDVAQARAQRGARQEALSESEQLRRADLSRVYELLNSMLQFTQAGRGTATDVLRARLGSNASNQAAQMGALGNLLSGIGSGRGGGGSGGGTSGPITDSGTNSGDTAPGFEEDFQQDYGNDFADNPIDYGGIM